MTPPELFEDVKVLETETVELVATVTFGSSELVMTTPNAELEVEAPAVIGDVALGGT